MNGVHDMGGMMGFGPVAREAGEPVFHADWERRTFALNAVVPGSWTLDMWRHAVECLAPVQYLSSSYYEKWLAVLENLMIEHGLATPEEIATGRSRVASAPVAGVVTAAAVAGSVAQGAPKERPSMAPARFSPGDTVRARNLHPQGHTRLPRYVRGHRGTVERVHGCHVFPDSNAHGAGEQPQWLYGVRFAASDLWGEAAANHDSVNVDLWEPYVEPA
jgi:nitrile hydratase subunit beta